MEQVTPRAPRIINWYSGWRLLATSAITVVSAKLIGLVGTPVALLLFFWLQPKRGTLQAAIVAAVAGVLVAVAYSAVVLPALHGNQQTAPAALTPPANSNADAIWTQESTRNSEVGPWLDYAPQGARFCRSPDGTIFTVFPPGTKPDAPKANQACLDASVTSAKQL